MFFFPYFSKIIVMETIHEPTLTFDFSKITLGQPQPAQCNSYFTKILFNDKPLYCQFPKCKTKQGIIQTDKKIFSDLLYDINIHNELSDWLENLESQCQKLIFDKRHLWFQNDLEMNDIECAFNPCSRMYKSGKQFLIRCYISKPSMIKLNDSSCIVYDENENYLRMEDIDINKEIIPLLKIDGIKFTNRNFQIDIHILQIMIINEQQESKKCLIKHKQLANSVMCSDIDMEHNKTQCKDNDVSDDVLKETIDNNKEHQHLNNLESKIMEQYIDLNTVNDINNISDVDNLMNINNCNNIDDNVKSCKLYDKDKLINSVDMNKKHISNDVKCSNDKSVNNDINELNILENKNLKKECLGNKVLESSNLELIELDFNDFNNTEDTIILRKKNEIYYEIYKKARDKAKIAKINAINAYLEAKNIKSRYMLNDLDDSDDDTLNI